MDYATRFFTAVVSETGAEALQKAGESIPGLSAHLVPRAIIGWLAAQTEGFSGPLPGIDDSLLVLTKGEESFAGIISVGERAVAFRDAPLVEVAAGLAVMLGADFSAVDTLQKKELARLGESVDKLVAALAKKKQIEKAELPGQAAAPREQHGPVAPEAPRKQRRQSGPSRRPSEFVKREIPLSRGDLEKVCPKCSKAHFSSGKFIGCRCLSPAAKEDYRFISRAKDYVFAPGEKWSPADLSVFLATVRA